LWATEDTIYGRFGYGMASMAAEIDLPREHTAPFARSMSSGKAGWYRLPKPSRWSRRSMTGRACDAGMFARAPAWWQDRVLADQDWRRGNAGHLRCAVLEIGLSLRLTPSIA